MKLLVPPLKISENDGFKPELDIFNRKAYGQSLHNLITNTEDELVIALDAPWGEGKTTFIKMWQGLLNENKMVANVYFDAFENDYQQDPLLAISSQLYALIDKKDKATQVEFKKKAMSALKVIGRAGLKVGIKALTAGALDETILEETGIVDDASEETSDIVDKFIEQQLTKHEESKKSLNAFKNYLATLPEKLGDGKKLIFIIDELDRCKPKFALAILESIKHLFSVPHITFVLVMNRNQIEEAIRCEYGNGVEASKYLQKFVSVWATLPKPNDERNPVIKTYLRNCLKSMNYQVKTNANQDAINIFQELAIHYDLSLREIERSLTNFAILYNATDEGDLNSEYLVIGIFLCIIKVREPSVFQQLLRNGIDYEQLLVSANLKKLKSSWWAESEDHELKWFLKYNLSSESIAKDMVSALKNNSTVRFSGQKAIRTLCKLMEDFQQG
jgi:predicted KAP-like P-loop ATPase